MGTATDTITYTYGNSTWGDLLTKYDGWFISYDAVGNPLNDGKWAYTWSQGRQLTRMTSNSSPNTYWAFTYDANGLRASRTNGSTTYKYHYDGGQLTRMMIGNTLLEFTYDASGKPVSVYYNGSYYYYALNLQGDVVAILNNSGVAVVRYTYDAWGRHLSISGSMASTLGQYNPFRYRGYIYDSETGLYYVSSRYYDPEIGRWINADGFISTGQDITGYNMFTYCGNNPVNRKDPSGQGWIAALVITAVIVAVSVVVVKIVADKTIDKSGANDVEKALAKNDYIAAYQVNEAKTITEDYIDKVYGRENDLDGTQVNAYRHAMWNAVMTDKIGEKKAKKFADAHEQFPNNPVEHMEMDLHNNELGRRIALEYAGQGYDVFSQKIQEAINNGEAIVIWDPSVK